MPAIILSDNGATSGSAGLKTSGGNDGVLQLQTTTSGGTPTTAISISNTQVVTYTNQPTYTGGTANGVLYLNGSKAVTSGTALVFDGSNLGIGVTPSAWSSSGNLQATNVGSKVNGTSFANNAYYDSVWKYASSSFAGLYSSVSGQHQWYIAGSGTAGNAISFTQAMTLDAAGNLGVGVTPSGWTLGKAFQVGSTSAILDFTGVTYFSGNWYYGGGQKFITNGYAGQYQISTSDGKHIWTTTTASNSSGAGATATFSTLMTLDASGNLGIGTTSPANRLHVAGITATLKLEGTSTGSADYINFYNAADKAYVGIESVSGTGIIGSSSAYSLIVSTASTNPLVFGTNGTERARIDASGYMRVGPYTPPNLGYVTPTTNSSQPSMRVAAGSGTADGSIILMVDKYSGTQTTSQWFLGFTINNQTTASGVITANGASQAAFGSWSDLRLKENIVDLPPQLANIMRLRPVEFDYIESEGGGHQTSFIAQEFEEVYPDAIGERPDGMKTLTGWGKTEARLVKAIQELKAEIDVLKGQA